jgi:hypothetical protein
MFIVIVGKSVRSRFFIQRMEYDQRLIIRFLYKARVSPEDIHTCLEEQFRDAPYRDRSVRRGCQYVQQGREDLHDEVRSGRPPIDFLSIRILALLDKQPFGSAYLIAEARCVFYSPITSHFREPLGMKNFHLRWIRHELTTSLR